MMRTVRKVAGEGRRAKGEGADLRTVRGGVLIPCTKLNYFKKFNELIFFCYKSE